MFPDTVESPHGLLATQCHFDTVVDSPVLRGIDEFGGAIASSGIMEIERHSQNCGGRREQHASDFDLREAHEHDRQPQEMAHHDGFAQRQ